MDNGISAEFHGTKEEDNMAISIKDTSPQPEPSRKLFYAVILLGGILLLVLFYYLGSGRQGQSQPPASKIAKLGPDGKPDGGEVPADEDAYRAFKELLPNQPPPAPALVANATKSD